MNQNIQVTSHNYIISRIDTAMIISQLTKAELGHQSIEVHVFRVKGLNQYKKIGFRYKLAVRIDDTAYEMHNPKKTIRKAINYVIAQFWADKLKENDTRRIAKTQ